MSEKTSASPSLKSSGKAAPRLHRQTLIEVNIAVHTARRNAAHDHVVSLLRNRRVGAAIEQRKELYGLCEDLIAEAILCTRRSLVQVDSPVVHYLTILKDTIAATESLILHEIELTKETGEFVKILGDALEAQLKAFSDTEAVTVGYIEELLEFGLPLLDKDTSDRLDAFSDDDRRRYKIATEEFKRHYSRKETEILKS